MKPTQDLSGKVFGELTAIKRVEINDCKLWECLCSCGHTVRYNTSQLNCGNAKTCKSSIHKLPYKYGDIVGQLTVIDLVRDTKNGRFMVNTKCSCGKLYTTAVKNMQRNKNPNCGCSRDTSGLGLPMGIGARNSLISSYKSNAKNKGHTFGLSVEECINLFKGNCFFCNEVPSKVYKKNGTKGSYTYNGIDRIDSTKGYETGNVNSCCMTCNYLKSNSTNELFLSKIKQIASNHGMS